MNEDIQNRLNKLEADLAELKLSRTRKMLRVARRYKRFLSIIALTGILIPVTIYALSITKTHTFIAGNPTVASEVNTNFDQLFTKVNDLAAYHPPVGTILAWHKSMAGMPALPATGEWVECNGQILSDAQSVLNGQVIPNLNGNAGGADSPGQSAKIAMFLRGGLTSGTGQQDAFQGWQAYADNAAAGGYGGYGVASGQYINTVAGTQLGYAIFATNQQGAANRIIPGGDGTNGTPRTANETRPVNMSVVWIMKVK